MKRLILWTSIALALVPLGCVDQNPAAVGPLPVERITPNAPQPVYYSGLQDPLRLVVSDQATLDKVWEQAFGSLPAGVPRLQAPVPPKPVVDFTRECVVVAALGGRGSGGYSVAVTGAVETNREVVIDVRSTSPGPGCAVTLGLTQPMDIVKLPRSTRTVRFAERSEITNCGAP